MGKAIYRKGNKYGVAKKEDRTYKGKVYDSKLEMQYRQHLDLISKIADPELKVLEIREQVPFKVKINGVLMFTYRIDFEVDYTDGTEYIDVKGMLTPIYRLKKKMVEAIYKIKIKEVYSGQF